jgi:hypothetical protein
MVVLSSWLELELEAVLQFTVATASLENLNRAKSVHRSLA